MKLRAWARRTFRPLRGTSEANKRAFLAVVVCAVLIAGWAVFNAFVPYFRAKVGEFLMVIPMFFAIPLLHVFIFRMNRRLDEFIDELKAKKFKVCIDCGYDLSAIADEGRCPECGRGYTREALEAAWRSRYPMYL